MTTPVKYLVREALVVTLHCGGPLLPDVHRSREDFKHQERYRFYIDTDKDKLEFIDWYLDMQDEDFFHENMHFHGLVNHSRLFIYYVTNFPTDDELKKEELVLPIATVRDKLALFEQLTQGISGPLAAICGNLGGATLLFDKVRARVPIYELDFGEDEPDGEATLPLPSASD